MQNRNANVDLSRILATIFVVTLHVMGEGGILQKLSSDTASYWIGWFIEICAYCAINIFVLISGYVMVSKPIKAKSIISLWLQVLFCSVSLTFLSFLLFPETRTIKNLIFSFVPVLSNQWWYISSYFVLFFFIPILNSAIHNLPQKTVKKILLLFLFGSCASRCVYPVDAFVLNEGYSAIWLIFIYLIGAYIRKYDLQEKITATKSLLLFLAMTLLTFLSRAGLHFGTKLLLGQERFVNILVSYTSISVVFSAIFIFMFCLNIRINDVSKKIIGLFAPTTLSVYLIHTHPLVFSYIMKDTFVSFAHMPLLIMLLCIFASILTIFLLCSAVDLLRIQLFKLLRISKLSDFIANKIIGLYLKIVKE